MVLLLKYHSNENWVNFVAVFDLLCVVWLVILQPGKGFLLWRVSIIQ